MSGPGRLHRRRRGKARLGGTPTLRLFPKDCSKRRDEAGSEGRRGAGAAATSSPTLCKPPTCLPAAGLWSCTGLASVPNSWQIQAGPPEHLRDGLAACRGYGPFLPVRGWGLLLKEARQGNPGPPPPLLPAPVSLVSAASRPIPRSPTGRQGPRKLSVWACGDHASRQDMAHLGG